MIAISLESEFPELGKDIIREFNIQAGLIGDYYSRLLGKIKGTSKVNIALFDPEVTGRKPAIIWPDKIIPVCTIMVGVNIPEMVRLSYHERAKFITDTARLALTSVTSGIALKKESVDDAYETIKKSNYQNAHFIGEVKYARSGKISAQIHLRFEEQWAIAAVVFNAPGASSTVVDIFKFLPLYYFINPIISKGKWSGKDIFIVRDVKDEIRFEVSFKNRTVNITFNPKVHTESQLRQMLELSRYRNSNDLPDLSEMK